MRQPSPDRHRADIRAERRECARLRNPRLITFREARFGDLQIQIAELVRKVSSIPRLHWLAQIVQFGVSGVFLVKAGHGHQNGAAWDDAGASHAATGSSVPINGATGDTS